MGDSRPATGPALLVSAVGVLDRACPEPREAPVPHVQKCTLHFSISCLKFLGFTVIQVREATGSGDCWLSQSLTVPLARGTPGGLAWGG